MNKEIESKLKRARKANPRFNIEFNHIFIVNPKTDENEICDEICASMIQSKLNKWGVLKGFC
jgi:hypothetical protein